MLDYVEKQTKELLEVFLDEPVVLVEIMSNMPEFNGKICAISRHSSGFVSLNELLKQGLETDETFSFGVSVRCLELMEKSKKRLKNRNKKNLKQKLHQENKKKFQQLALAKGARIAIKSLNMQQKLALFAATIPMLSTNKNHLKFQQHNYGAL